MGLDELLNELNRPKKIEKSIKDHPKWPEFCDRAIPATVSFYYENKDGEEAYFERLPVIKFDLKRLFLIAEGSQGDPLRFDIARISHCKNGQTGEKVQDLLTDLAQMWREVFKPQ